MSFLTTKRFKTGVTYTEQDFANSFRATGNIAHIPATTSTSLVNLSSGFAIARGYFFEFVGSESIPIPLNQTGYIYVACNITLDNASFQFGTTVPADTASVVNVIVGRILTNGGGTLTYQKEHINDVVDSLVSKGVYRGGRLTNVLDLTPTLLWSGVAGVGGSPSPLSEDVNNFMYLLVNLQGVGWPVNAYRLVGGANFVGGNPLPGATNSILAHVNVSRTNATTVNIVASSSFTLTYGGGISAKTDRAVTAIYGVGRLI